MNILIALTLGLVFGLAFRQRLGAYLAYIAAQAFLFTWASVVVITEWAAGDTQALGPFPDADTGQVTAYGLVNLAALIIGLAIVEAGHRGGARLRSRRSATVDLDPAR